MDKHKPCDPIPLAKIWIDGWGVRQHGLFKKKPQSMYFVVIASFAILSYTARVTARKVRIRLAGSWSWKHGLSNFIHGMGPVWNEMATLEWNGHFGMKWSQSGMNWLKWPFFMGTHGKTILWMKCLLFTPPALMPAGHKNRQALHRTGFGPKMMKKQPLPAKPALPKPRLRLRPAGIRTGRHPGLDQALARWFQDM